MKRLCIIICVLIATSVSISAQHLPRSFFDAKGNVRIETEELDEAADTLVKVFHRNDDIEWSRIVYRIIDMRYKQNYQLYFPVHTDNERYHNMFNVIADAVIKGMPIYSTEIGRAHV